MGSEFKGTFHTFVDLNDIIDVQNEFKNHNALGIIDRLLGGTTINLLKGILLLSI